MPTLPSHLFSRTQPSQTTSTSFLHTPKVLVPLILGGVLLAALFILAFRHWLWQVDHNTMQDIEAAVRPHHRSTSGTSQISAIDVEACRGALGRAARSTGRVMSSGVKTWSSSDETLKGPSPIKEEKADEMVDVDLRTFGGGGDGAGDDGIKDNGDDRRTL